MYQTLHEFIAALERHGELKRVSARVSPVLEIGEIADRVSKRAAAGAPSESARRNDPRFSGLGGHALLFENVEGSDFPVLVNAFGSYRRMEMALGCDGARGGFDAIAARIGELVRPEVPTSLMDALEKGRKLLPLLSMPPRRRQGPLGGRALCQEIVRRGAEVDLTRLPMLRCWPLDGNPEAVGYAAEINGAVGGAERGGEWDARHRGRYMTFAGIHTIHAQDRDAERPASHNIGMYRVQLLGRRTMAMHWHMHHDGARHWRSWKALGRAMPVAICFGGESVLPYAATAPLPPGMSELLLAGFLNGGGIELVRGATVPLWVPANAEVVVEGFVSTEAGFPGWDPRSGEAMGPGAAFEGPFGDHTGYYSMPDRYPLLEVTAVTHRRGAVFPATIVGLPPQEDYPMGKATERIFLPLLRTLVHDIEDYDLPMFGAFHNCAFVKIGKSYPLQGRRVMHSVWGAGQMAWTKTIFVVDEDCDVHDTFEVLRRAGRYCHPLRDVEAVNGPLDILDHASPRLGAGMKIGFDCTRKRAGEEVGGVALDEGAWECGDPGKMELYTGLVRRVPGVARVEIPDALGGAWMFLAIEKHRGGQGASTLEDLWQIDPARAGLEARHLPRFVVVLDGDAGAADIDGSLFRWVANCDFGRDLQKWRSEDGRVGRLGFDSTRKGAGDERNGEGVRPWPPILEMDAATRERVTRRWGEYFPGG